MLTILVHFVFVLISYLWVLSRFWGFGSLNKRNKHNNKLGQQATSRRHSLVLEYREFALCSQRSRQVSGNLNANSSTRRDRWKSRLQCIRRFMWPLFLRSSTGQQCNIFAFKTQPSGNISINSHRTLNTYIMKHIYNVYNTLVTRVY